MNQATRHMTPDAWLGVPLQLAIRDLAVVNGYAGALSVRAARRDILFAVEADLAVAALAGNDLDLCNINKHSVVLLSSGSMQQYYDH